MENPINDDLFDEDIFEDSGLSTTIETAEDFETNESSFSWKWLLLGCGGGLALALLCCVLTLAVLWYTGDALIESLMEMQ